MVCKKAYCEPMNETQRAIFKEFNEFMRFKIYFSLFLCFVILGCYFSFLILVAFFPNFLGISIGDSPVTLGIIFGICSILLGVLGTYIYGFVSNFFLDTKQDEILQKMQASGLIVEE